MPACVSEGSYNTIFVVATIIVILLLLLSSYVYDRFNKASKNELSSSQFNMSKNIALGSMILGIFALTVLIVVFFGFRTRMIGVYSTTNMSGDMATVIH